MTKFSEIPTNAFPMTFSKYCQLRSDLQTAAAGFDNLCTADSRYVSNELMKVHGQLAWAWELIRDIERRERLSEK